MLSVLTAFAIAPEIETIDRDPGIITLLSTLARNGARVARITARPARMVHETASRLSSSASAWPRHR